MAHVGTLVPGKRHRLSPRSSRCTGSVCRATWVGLYALHHRRVLLLVLEFAADATFADEGADSCA